MPFVIITKEKQGPGAEKVKTIELSGTTLRIGRGTDNDLHLDDHSVQLRHAVIQQVDEGYLLRDRNILSLTSVNDVPVTEVLLPEAGTIRIGRYTLRFTRHTPSAPLTIEYEVPADVRQGTSIATEAPTTLGSRTPGDMDSESTLPPATSALGVSTTPPAMGDEKHHLVAAYKLQGRYFNKTTITVLAVLVIFGGSALVWGIGKHMVFMPGSISLKHRLFANDCVRCHAPGKPILAFVPDQTCLTCHSGPPHFSDRALSPAPQCVSCHVEHKGLVLAALSDSTCLQCHTDLKVKEARIPIATTMHSFTADHPEFAITVSPVGQHTAQRVRLNERELVVDTAAIKLNHRLHLKADLMGPEGPEQLSCASCHQPNSQGAYMRPVTYEKDCMRCHVLDFDERLPGKVVPHGQSLEEVDRFLRTTYAEYYVLQHQPEVKSPAFARRLPGVTKSKELIWMDTMVEQAEHLLMGAPDSRTTKGKCVLCHMLDHTGGAALRAQVDGTKPTTSESASRMLFPTVVKTAMLERWLPYSLFDHKAHNIFQCVACHEAAPHSERTKDVLLPSIGSCQYCHFEPGGAQAQCLTCHVYHDKTQDQKPGHEPYSIEQFRGQPSLLSQPAVLPPP